MALVKIEPYGVDNIANFTFGGLTITSNAVFGNASLGNLATANFVTVSSNLTSGNANLGNAATANYFIGNGSLLTGITTTSLTNGTSNVVVTNNGNATISIGGTSNVVIITTSGANVNGYVSATRFVGEAGNLSNIQGANVSGAVASATISATVTTAAQPNITSLGLLANLSVNGNSSFIGNANIVGNINQSGGTTSLNNVAITGASVSLGSVSNLHISGGSANYVLQTDGAGNLAWTAQASGGSNANVAYTTVTVDTFTGDGVQTVFTLSVTPGSINQTYINYNGASQLKSAYTLSGANVTFSEAPANGSIIEVTTTMGVATGNGNLTVRTYTGDNTTVAFTVSSGASATNILVTQNGLLQTPTTDYTVSSGTLTFATAPGTGEKVQIRELGTAIATITTPGANTQVLFNNNGSFGNSANFTFNNTTNTLSVPSMSVTGDIVPTSNVTYNLGSPTNRFKDLYLSGNTIDLAGATIKTDATTGAIALVPQPTVAAPNPTALIISSTGAISTATTTGGTISANTLANAVANSSVVASYGTISLSQAGNITSPFTGVARCYPTSNVNIVNIFASLGTPSSSSFQFTLKKNGSNVGNYTVSANSYRMTPASANITVSTTDYLTLDITSGTGATDLKVDLQYKLQ